MCPSGTGGGNRLSENGAVYAPPENRACEKMRESRVRRAPLDLFFLSVTRPKGFVPQTGSVARGTRRPQGAVVLARSV